MSASRLPQELVQRVFRGLINVSLAHCGLAVLFISVSLLGLRLDRMLDLWRLNFGFRL